MKRRGWFRRGGFRRGLRALGVVTCLASSLLAEVPKAVPLSAKSSERIDVEAVANAITELDVVRAQRYLEQLKAGGDALALQRARLALYVGDCDSAEAILKAGPERADFAQLASLAQSCARATAGGRVVEDREQGVWMRFQDAEDEALAPYLARVAARARDTMARDLGVELPKPLRIDLVRDLFSLAGVSGLPVEAAETTGTVAIARWGRIIMLSPRAATAGYPWEDTLAHEITHLALARGSRDFAPLWLQEGIAKREEVRWREPRPFDDLHNPHQVAREALINGKSVGIDKIGPSIAMLPTPEAAGISYAEVQSFMDFWIGIHGPAAFALLLADLRGLGVRDTEPVMLSITGYPLSYWIARWQQHLLALPEVEKPEPPAESQAGVAQSVRLGDLLIKQGDVAAATEYFSVAAAKAGTRAPVRFRAASAQLKVGATEAARTALGELDQVSGLFGSWLGLHARLLNEAQKAAEAERAWALAIAVDPLGEEAACGGHSAFTSPIVVNVADLPAQNLPLPAEPTRRKLCEAARKIVRD